MKIKKLSWESDFFNKNVFLLEYESDFGKHLTFDEEVDFLIVQGITCLNQIEINNLKNTYTETKVVYTKKVATELHLLSSNLIDFDDKAIDIQNLYNLAFESGKYSRFKLDENIDESHFIKLYQLWIDNSINKSFADKCFYYKLENRIVGFITLKIVEHTATIGLIAVDPSIQGKGIGNGLLNMVENYCIQNNCLNIDVATQKHNELACRFYKKNNYIVKNELNIAHFWKI